MQRQHPLLFRHYRAVLMCLAIFYIFIGVGYLLAPAAGWDLILFVSFYILFLIIGGTGMHIAILHSQVARSLLYYIIILQLLGMLGLLAWRLLLGKVNQLDPDLSNMMWNMLKVNLYVLMFVSVCTFMMLIGISIMGIVWYFQRGLPRGPAVEATQSDQDHEQ